MGALLLSLTPPPVVLSNRFWRVSIDPGSLRVSALLSGSGKSLTLSGPKGPKDEVANLQTTSHDASWRLLESGLTVSMSLQGKTLSVQLTSKRPGEFTWPICPASDSNRSYIHPLGEGVEAPTHDRDWVEHLSKHDPLSTTENLFLPLWGIDDGAHMLTYQLTNPFNNELGFQNVSGSLASSLTHTFTRNWTEKSYGLRITLGRSGPIEPALEYRRWLEANGGFVSLKSKIGSVPEAAKLLGAAHVYLWGDGVSKPFLQQLNSSGLDRLWLGSPSWGPLQENPGVIRLAKALGYLIGPYDSYDSVHSPDAKPDDTWETAQFDQKLFDTGGIVLANGKKKSGFEGKGYYLNESAVEPYMKRRVDRLVKQFDCNSWFMDCDAAGEFYDDYSPDHPANQSQEMLARLGRMAWIRDRYKLVVGSEGGAAYSASTIHFAHGVETPVFGWNDPKLKDKNSPYYLGAYYPAEGPAVFFKQVPLDPDYYHFHFDPRFQIPLYQAAFHDSLIATHHWTEPTLKYSDQVVDRTLLELLDQVPPLFHLNSADFGRRKAWIQAEYRFFSPLHRKTALLPLTHFDWLTKDHLVQRTRFGSRFEMIANFGDRAFSYLGCAVPAKSILSRDRTSGKTASFAPKPS